MRSVSSLLAVLAGGVLLAAPPSMALGVRGSKPKVAVMEFRSQPGGKLPANCAIVLQDILISGIKSKAMDQCDVLTARESSSGMATGRRSGSPGGGGPRMIAKRLGADYMLTGTVRSVLSGEGDTIGHRTGRRRQGAGGQQGSGQQIIAVLIAARLMNTSTGQVVWQGQQRSEPITIDGMGGMDSATFQKYAQPVSNVLVALLIPQIK